MVDRRIVIGAAVVGVGGAGYLIYRHQKNAQAASQAAAASSAQAASGYGYGAGGGSYGYGAGAGYSADGYYGYGASGGFAPQGYYGYGTPTPNPPGGGGGGGGNVPVTTNAQWAQAAINQLTNEGYDPIQVSAALGAYELGQPVTAGQDTIVQSAIGIEGYPPQSGADGYPPGIHVQGTPGGGTGGGQGGGGGGSGGGTTVKVPNVVGDRADDARQTLRRAGLTYNISNSTTGKVTKQSPVAGASVKNGSKVNLTVARGR